MAGRGRANSVDVRVGNRLRLRRTAIGMSQEDLSEVLPLLRAAYYDLASTI